jgi:hypothetical protein
VIEIEEPPDIQACAIGVPLVWLWSLRSRTWKSFEPVDGDTDTMRRHRCERHGDPRRPYEQLELRTEPDPAITARTHAGAALVRAELAKSQEQQREGDPS